MVDYKIQNKPKILKKLMLQTKSQGHLPLGSRKCFECFIINGHGGHCRVGLGQPRIIICENFVEPTLPMLHTMSQALWPFDFRDDFKGILLSMCAVVIVLYLYIFCLGHVTINKWRF